MVEGKFIRELKNRFLCEVKIDGKVEECYVPSSCHLSNFLQLKGKRVLLIPTQGKNPRTRYALYAAPYRRNYIILNTSLSNVAIEKNIYKELLYVVNGHPNNPRTGMQNKRLQINS
jgi:DNA-binding sugar fermentation-stimulating protein